ncbi:hypothetical protein ABPG73_008373 [Tetrahymena malaccensis]
MQRIQNDESDFLKYSVGGSEILKKSVDLNDTTIKRERRNGENQNVNELQQQLSIGVQNNLKTPSPNRINEQTYIKEKFDDQIIERQIQNCRLELLENLVNLYNSQKKKVNQKLIQQVQQEKMEVQTQDFDAIYQRDKKIFIDKISQDKSIKNNQIYHEIEKSKKIQLEELIINTNNSKKMLNGQDFTDKLNLLNGSFLIFIASNLKNSKKLRLIGEIEENNDLEDEDYIGNAIQSIQQKYPITIQLCLDISNQITQDTKNDLDETQIQSDYQLGNKENDCYLAQDFFKGLMQKCESLFQNKEDNQNYYENILFFEDVRQSKSQIEKIREIFSNVLKGNHQAITLCQNSIRNCYMSLLEINKKKKPKNDDYLTIKYLNNIGYCSLQLNEYSNSLKYYLESFGLLSQQKEENENLIFQKNQALLYLFINYQLIGDKQKAEQYRQKDPLFEKQAEKELIKFQTRKIEKK